MAGVELVELGIDEKMKDHVHLVIIIPPKYSVSDVVARLKGESASMMRKKFTKSQQAVNCNTLLTISLKEQQSNILNTMNNF